MKTELLIAERKVVEKALLASEQLNRTLIASTSDYVYTVTIDGGRAQATSHGQGCETITGFTPREFDADPSLWYQMIEVEDRPAVLQQVTRILNGEAPRPLEHRIIHKDGTVRWIRNVAILRRSEDGQLISYNGLISDITERKRAEQLIVMQYAVTRQLAEADTLPDALVRILRAVCETFAWDWGALWNLDRKAKLLRWGEIWHEDKSMELEPFRRESAALTFAQGAGLPGRVWATDQPAWITDAAKDQAFTRALIADRSGLHGFCAFPIHREDQVAGVIELLSHRVEPPDPEMMQMLTMVGTQIGQFIAQKSAEDERKQSQEKQRLSEARLQAVLDHSPAVIYLKDTEGRYLLVNRRFETVSHLRGEEVIGKTDTQLFPLDLAKAFQANDEKVLAGMTPLEVEEVAPHEDGTHTYISVKFPLVGDAGTAYAVCGISTDISERKRAEQLLHRAYDELAQNEASLKQTVQELKAAHEELKATEMQLIQAAKMECIGTLAAGVAHEVKNPLQTMLMGLHYLAQNSPANQGTALAIQDMREAVTRANAILSGLLELSTVTPCERKAENLNACVERSLWLLHYELVATHTTVVRRLASDLPLVPMDRRKIEQVFINLFINALHAMPEGGTLTVTTRTFRWSEDLASQEPILRQFKTGDTLAVTEVHDTGTGIPENLLPKVFDPFFTTKAAGHGTGLGLAVVKKIVDLHGGAVVIRNAPPGGALVTLILRLE